MIPVYSDIIRFKGTHYQFGYMQGEQLKDSPILAHRDRQWRRERKRHFVINKQVYQDIIRTFLPAMWDEIEGLADALKWPIDRAIREFGGYYLEYGKSGCSIFTTDQYMVRNYDNHPQTYEGRYAIFQPTDGGYATIGPSMQITGRTDGMNEKGLAMGYNFVNRKKSDDGFVCNMIGRIVLETCANVDEAIELLKAIPHRHTFNYVLLDPKGETFIVEASPRRVAVRQGLVCTNHFETLLEENRYRMDDSEARERAILTGQQDVQDPFMAFSLLNDPDKGVFSRKYGAYAGTLHTAIYFPQDMKVGIGLGENQRALVFDFNRLINSERVQLKRIIGKLNANAPFINVE